MFLVKLFMSTFLSCTIVWAVAQEGSKRTLPGLLEERPWLALPLIGLAAVLYWVFGLSMKEGATPAQPPWSGPSEAAAVELQPKPFGPAGSTSAEAERFVLEDHISYGL